MIKIGIIGTGRIARRFMSEQKHIDGVIAEDVYNPNKPSAIRFAEDNGMTSVWDSLGELFEAVDAVYIATPHETHAHYAREALNNGCHVLCEKPMSFKADEAKALFALAEERQLVLMEALKTAYAPGFIKLVKEAKSGTIGEIRDVEACFTKLVEDREGAREYTGPYRGSFAELASYPLLAIISILGTEYESLDFHSFRNDEKTDVYTKAYLRYNNMIATAKTGIGVKSEGQLLVSGTKGYILARSPWWLPKTYDVCFEDGSRNYTVNTEFEGDGLRYEIREFIDRINGLGSRRHTSVESIECRKNQISSEKISHDMMAGGDDAGIPWKPKDSIALAGILEQFYKDKI